MKSFVVPEWYRTQRLISGSVNGDVQIWDPITKKCIALIKTSDPVHSIEILRVESPPSFTGGGGGCTAGAGCGTVLATSSDDPNGATRIWVDDNLSPPHPLSPPPPPAQTAASVQPISSPALGVVTTGVTGIDLAPPQSEAKHHHMTAAPPAPPISFTTHRSHNWRCASLIRGGATALTVLKDRSGFYRLATASVDKRVRLWDFRAAVPNASPLPGSTVVTTTAPTAPTTGAGPVNCSCLATMSGHTERIDCLLSLPDARTLVSGSWDMCIKVWDCVLFQCVRTLTGHSGTVTCLALLSETRFVSGSDDHTCRVWDLNHQLHTTAASSGAGGTGGADSSAGGAASRRGSGGHERRGSGGSVGSRGGSDYDDVSSQSRLVSTAGGGGSEYSDASSVECVYTLASHTTMVNAIAVMSEAALLKIQTN